MRCYQFNSDTASYKMSRFSSSAKPGTSKLIIAALLCAFVIAAKGTTGQEQEDVEYTDYSNVTVSDDIYDIINEGERETTTSVPSSTCKKLPNTRYAMDYTHSPLAELGGCDAALTKCLENPKYNKISG